jgi:hypothetical protein
MKKIISYFLFFIVSISSMITCIGEPVSGVQLQSDILNLPGLNHSLFLINQSSNPNDMGSTYEESRIRNYTWAVMRYDHITLSENHGPVNIPTPSVGTILIPTNMMSVDVCRAALSVNGNSKMETLAAFDVYVSERMLHTSSAFYDGEDEWHTETCYNYRKESADEMSALGDICVRADLVGECYAQASFNTAVLRLCGFSAEEVFTIGIQSYQGGHAVNVVNVEDQWFVLDSTYARFVRMGMRDSIIFKQYFRPPITEYLVSIENDKYLINFGNLYPQYIPTLADPYSNIESNDLSNILNGILPLFNYSYLGRKKWSVQSFVENATPNPWMKTMAIPITVEDAEGVTIEEKAQSLMERCKEFVWLQVDEPIQNQYDKSLYALGVLSVEYPQVYATAAKLAAWTSWYAMEHDTQRPFLDLIMTSFWIKLTMFNRHVVSADCVAYSDLLYLRHAGSSVDKAVLAYGTLRNMKKDSDFWSIDDLHVLITEEKEGYLAVNLNDNWKYMSFETEVIFSDTAPEDIEMVFNEEDYFASWEE